MISGQCVHVATVWNAIRVGDGLYEFLLAVYWRFWQGQLLPYAPQAKRALYAKPATTLFLKALRQVVDSTAGDVVQLVRTLPCRWLESYTVTAEPHNQLPHRTFNHLERDLKFLAVISHSLAEGE